MSAVAVSQQSQPAQPSLNTPGFFTQAFLELNVFEQCFSSLQAESIQSTSASTSASAPTSEQKMNNSIDSLHPPSPRSIGHQNSGNEYSTTLGGALSLPSPMMGGGRFPTVQQHQNNVTPGPMYQAVDRRFSLQEVTFQSSSTESQPSVAGYHISRRYSHQQPLDSSFSTSPGTSAWAENMIGRSSFGSDQRQSTGSPQMQYYIPHPTPPNSTHSNSPVEKFSTDGPPQSQLSPVENLSPLDTMIIDDRTNSIGQATPPAENPTIFDGPECGSGSGFQALSEVSSQPPVRPEISKTNTRAKRGSAKAGPSSSRKPKKGTAAPPPVEPEIDIHDVKRKRFLERNRVAASKCRQKKKMWMQELEHNARTAQNHAKNLNTMVSCLREEVLQLKGMLLKHSGCSCSQISTYLLNEAAKVANGAKQSMESMENSKTAENQAATSFQMNNSQVDTSRMSQLRYSSSTNEDENPFDDDDSMLGDFGDELELHDPRGLRSP